MAASRQLANAYVTVGANDTAFQATLGRIHARLTALKARMEVVSRVAKRMFMAFGAAMAFAVYHSTRFEQSMARVKALTGATGGAFAKLTSQARALGRTTQFSAAQSAEAMSAFALAGFSVTKIMQAMPATLNLAAAGQLQIGQAADITAKIMAGMGLSAGELTGAVDILAKAFTTANTDLPMLGEAMKMVGPVAKAAGKDLTEVVAIIQVLSNVGLQGTMAGTGLRMVLVGMAKNGKEVKKVFGSLGVEIKDSTGKIRPMADIVDDFNAALKRTGKENDALGMSMAAFGARAGSSFVAMLEQGGDELRRLEGQLQDAGGTAAEIAETQMNTLIGALKYLWSALSDVAIELGNIFNPMIRKAAENLTHLLASIGELTSSQKDAIKTWTLFGASLTAIVVILGPLTKGLLGLVTAVKLLGMTTGAAAAATGGIGLIIVALGLLAAVWATAKMKGESFGDTLMKIVHQTTGLRNAVVALQETLDQEAAANKMMQEAEEIIAKDRKKRAREELKEINEKMGAVKASLAGKGEKVEVEVEPEPPEGMRGPTAEQRKGWGLPEIGELPKPDPKTAQDWKEALAENLAQHSDALPKPEAPAVPEQPSLPKPFTPEEIEAMGLGPPVDEAAEGLDKAAESAKKLQEEIKAVEAELAKVLQEQKEAELAKVLQEQKEAEPFAGIFDLSDLPPKITALEQQLQDLKAVAETPIGDVGLLPEDLKDKTVAEREAALKDMAKRKREIEEGLGVTETEMTEEELRTPEVVALDEPVERMKKEIADLKAKEREQKQVAQEATAAEDAAPWVKKAGAAAGLAGMVTGVLGSGGAAAAQSASQMESAAAQIGAITREQAEREAKSTELSRKGLEMNLKSVQEQRNKMHKQNMGDIAKEKAAEEAKAEAERKAAEEAAGKGPPGVPGRMRIRYKPTPPPPPAPMAIAGVGERMSFAEVQNQMQRTITAGEQKQIDELQKANELQEKANEIAEEAKDLLEDAKEPGWG